MDTLFIQFYNYTGEPHNYYSLQNGFSETYDFCKNKGDFLWLDSSKDIILPISSGTVYASVTVVSNLYQIFLLAKEYPNINFIVGGPAVNFPYKIKETLPKNFLMTTKSVEEWFGIENFSGKWKLEIEDHIPKNSLIAFSYFLDNSCYWDKCIFCTYSKRNTNRYRKNLSFEFTDIKYTGNKIVRITTPTIKPKYIKTIFPILPEDFKYRIFLRTCKAELESLRSVGKHNLKNIMFTIGLEFPTSRMWNSMKKGYSQDTAIEILEFLEGRVVVNFIVGWNNLKKEDLIELEKFMKRMPKKGKKTYYGINNLFAMVGTEIHDSYEKLKDHFVGPFYMGFYPKLSKEQTYLNSEAKKIILNYTQEEGCEDKNRGL